MVEEDQSKITLVITNLYGDGRVTAIVQLPDPDCPFRKFVFGSAELAREWAAENNLEVTDVSADYS